MARSRHLAGIRRQPELCRRRLRRWVRRPAGWEQRDAGEREAGGELPRVQGGLVVVVTKHMIDMRPPQVTRLPAP